MCIRDSTVKVFLCCVPQMPADPAALMIDILEAGDPTHNSATPGEKAPVGNGVTHGSKNGAPASRYVAWLFNPLGPRPAALSLQNPMRREVTVK